MSETPTFVFLASQQGSGLSWLDPTSRSIFGGGGALPSTSLLTAGYLADMKGVDRSFDVLLDEVGWLVASVEALAAVIGIQLMTLNGEEIANN